MSTAAGPTFVHPLTAHASAHPRRVALVGTRTWSTAQLCEAVATRAQRLRDEGLAAGDVFQFSADRGDDWILTAAAVWWLGATFAPAAFAPATSATQRPTNPRSGRVEPWAWRWDDALCRLQTSGSTGAPRTIALTFGQWLVGAWGSLVRLGHLPTDRWLHVLPLHHVGGLAIVYRCLLYGTAVELAAVSDARQTAEALLSGRCSHVSLTPRMLSGVLEVVADQQIPNSVRTILVGGGPMPAALLFECERRKLPIARTWGMTEAASQLATTEPGDFDAGGLPPLPFVNVERDESERLVVSGPAVSGTLVTNDLGFVSADGRVTVSGRLDDAIVSGGAKLQPSVIEAVVRQHPQVVDVAVVGRRSAAFGHRPVAFVQLTKATASAAVRPDLREFCTQGLPRHAVPDAVYLCDPLPRTAIGKVAVGVLRQNVELAHELYELVWDRAALELGEGHKRVPQPNRATQDAVLAADPVLEGGGPLAEPADRAFDDEAIVHANRLGVAGLRVNERHAEADLVEVGISESGEQDLVKTVMGVLESARKEGDPGAIHVMKPGGSSVGERQGVGLQE